jgi:hypothetical protein
VIDRRQHEACCAAARPPVAGLPETLATADPFLAHARDRLGVHPLARIEGAAADVRRTRSAGDRGLSRPPLRDGASPALRRTLDTRPASLPRHLVRLGAGRRQASRSARRARR